MTRVSRDDIYQLERRSIRAFVQAAASEGLLAGRVLDYGCGAQPYRDIVEQAGGEYLPYDRADFPGGNGGTVGNTAQPFDQILCCQVLQYLPDPAETIDWFQTRLAMVGGLLVLTGPSSWHEEEPTSLWRWTRAGIRLLLEQAGFTVERLDDRGTVDLGGFGMSVGWGAVARA